MFDHLVQLLTALLVAIAPLIGYLNKRKLDSLEDKTDRNHEVVLDVQHQVATSNGITVGQAVDGAESRRIDAIPAEDRTAAEAKHIVAVPVPVDAHAEPVPGATSPPVP
jgi:hypothetical protein